MSETHPFFRWLYRCIALGALGLALLLGYVVVRVWWSSSTWQRENTVEVPSADGKPDTRRPRLSFRNLTELPGTTMRTLDVGSPRSARSGFSSGSYGDMEINNLIFLPRGNAEATWLFPDNDQSITKKTTITARGDDSDSISTSAPVIALLLVVSRDANADGTVDEKDAAVPMLVKPDGSALTELLPAVARVLDIDAAADGSTIGLLCEVQGALVFREYSTQDFRKISERIITKIR